MTLVCISFCNCVTIFLRGLSNILCYWNKHLSNAIEWRIVLPLELELKDRLLYILWDSLEGSKIGRIFIYLLWIQSSSYTCHSGLNFMVPSLVRGDIFIILLPVGLVQSYRSKWIRECCWMKNHVHLEMTSELGIMIIETY